MLEFYGVIYLVTNAVNGKQYVGQTTKKNSQRYIKGHFLSAQKGHRKYLYAAIRKNGEEAFISEIIWRCLDKTSLDFAEDWFIRLFDTMAPRGYNLKGGGARGKGSEEFSKVMKAALGRVDVRERLLAALERNRANPEYTERRLTASAIAQKTSEARANKSAASKISQNNPITAERRDAAMQVVYAVPGFLEKRNARIKNALNTPESKIKQSESSRNTHANPITKEKHRNSLRNLLWINNGTTMLRIQKDLELPVGWSYGKCNSPALGRHINDGTQNRRLAENDPLPNGWAFGMIMNKERLRLKGKKKWITDGKISLRVEVDLPLPNGFNYGRHNNFSPGRFINNGKRNSRIMKNGIPPPGWVYGRLPKPVKEP